MIIKHGHFSIGEYRSMKKDPATLSDKGFTLIEMAVVMVIVGIVISIMVTVLPSLIQTAKIKEARAILEKTDHALQGFAISNNRLPFADNDGDGLEDDNHFTGDLPYITIGLSSGDDAWGNPIRYGVYGETGGSSNLTQSFADGTEFCSAITSASQSAFSTDVVYTTTLDACAGSNETNSSNQAYVLASGGAKDMDGTAGFFDLCNGTAGAGFNREGKIPAPDYDDIVRAFSLGELNQKICSGSGGGGGGSGSGGTAENTDELCSDGIDNDGDGFVDCHDQDCCSSGVTVCPDGCPPPDDIRISQTAMDPARSGDQSYYHLFNATGGSGAYFWFIDSISPAIPGLSIDLWTGVFSGQVDNCSQPTPYSVTIRAEDRENSSRTDTHSFLFTVNPSQVEIEPRPLGTGDPDFLVNSAMFERFFWINEIDGGHVGDFVWTINWNSVDPGGFQINPTSEGGQDPAVSAKLWKSGAVEQPAGIYSFTLTATDSVCSQNTYTSNTYSIEITQQGIDPPYTESMEAMWQFDECHAWDSVTHDVVDDMDIHGDERYFGMAMGGMAATHSGKLCRAAWFDGNDDKIVSRVLTEDQWIFFGQEVTLACWFKSPGGGGTNPRLIEFSNADGSYQWSTALAYDRDGSLRAWVTDQATGIRAGEIDYSSRRYDDNQWHHVVYTYSAADGGMLYIDKEFKASASNNPVSSIHDAETFVIGGYYPDNNHGFNGAIDEVMVFSSAFSQEQVNTLYQITRSCSSECYTGPVAEYRMENFPWNGTENEVLDSGTGNSNGIAASRGTGELPFQTSPSGGKVCRSGVFERIDGSNGGYLDPGDPADGDLDPGTDPWTVSAWINWDGSTGENIIYNKENLYEARVNNGYVQYAWQPHWVWDAGTSFPVSTDTWTYVTTLYDGRYQTLYKNGVPVFSRPQNGAIGSNSARLLIGARGSTSPRNFFGGMIDEVRIYNRLLSESEIVTDMNQTRDCGADSVVIETVSLADGVVGQPYSSQLTATGGTSPYAWQIVSNPFSSLSLSPVSGAVVNLTGTILECAGDYDVVIRVTDDADRIDERTFTLTVNNGSFTITPAPPGPLVCDTADFSQDFSVDGPVAGTLENFTLSWITASPGGFELVPLGANNVQLKKVNSSVVNDGYLFRITAQDSQCPDNIFVSGTYELDITGQGGEAPFNQGLTGGWSLDECAWDGTAGEIVDISETGAHGQSHNMGDPVTDQHRFLGKVCKSAALNIGGPTDQYITLGHDAFQGLTSFSFSLWFQLDELSTTLSPLFSGASSSEHNVMLIFIDAGGSSIRTYLNGSQTGLFNTGSSLADGVWHHLIWIWDGGSGDETLYLDTVSYPDSAGAVNTDPVSLDPGGAIIGQEQDSLGGGFAVPQEIFQGWIDEVRIYDRAVNQEEVDIIYAMTRTCTGGCYSPAVAEYRMDEASWVNDDTVYDASGNDYHGEAARNAAIETTDSYLCNSASFPASSSQSHVLIPENGTLLVSGTPGHRTTLCFWMKWSGNDKAMPVGWSSDYGLILTSSPERFGFTTDGTDIFGIDISGGQIQDTWRHIAAVFSSDDEPGHNQLYIDGILQPCIQLNGTWTDRTVSGRLYLSGWNNGNVYKFGGLLDEVRVYDRGLSGSEVIEDMNLFHECP